MPPGRGAIQTLHYCVTNRTSTACIPCRTHPKAPRRAHKIIPEGALWRCHPESPRFWRGEGSAFSLPQRRTLGSRRRQPSAGTALPERAKPGHWSGPRLVQGSEDSVRDEPPSPVVGFRSGLGGWCQRGVLRGTYRRHGRRGRALRVCEETHDATAVEAEDSSRTAGNRRSSCRRDSVCYLRDLKAQCASSPLMPLR
jgi:hypothetical protein